MARRKISKRNSAREKDELNQTQLNHSFPNGFIKSSVPSNQKVSTLGTYCPLDELIGITAARVSLEAGHVWSVSYVSKPRVPTRKHVPAINILFIETG